MIQKPIEVSDLVNYQECDGRYFMLKYKMIGHIIKETKIFMYKHNLNAFLYKNEALFESSALYVLDEE